MRKVEKRVRITAQLIDATNDGHLWAERFDRDLTDIFAVQDDVTGQIVGALSLNLAQGDRRRLLVGADRQYGGFRLLPARAGIMVAARKRAERPGAGAATPHHRTRPAIRAGIRLAGAAQINDYVSQWTDQPSRSLDLAYEAATRSAALDPKLPAAYWALIFANLWMWRYDDAIRAGKTAIANNPNDAEALNGSALSCIRRPLGGGAALFRASDGAKPLCPGMWLHFKGQADYQCNDTRKRKRLKRRIFRTPETDASRVLLAATSARRAVSTRRANSGARSFASTPPILWNTGARCCPTRTQPTSRPSLMGSERRAWLNRLA